MSEPLSDGEGGLPAGDDALVAAARRGEQRAFEQLLARHEGGVLRLLRLLGVPAADREDVAQEIFVRAFRHLGGFRAGKKFRGWLHRITVNQTHDYRRRAARLRGREAGWEEAGEPTADDRDDPGSRMERSDRRLVLERALDALSERERAVFVLCEMDGQPNALVARSLGISAITVRRHLGRARRRLREALDRIDEKKEPAG